MKHTTIEDYRQRLLKAQRLLEKHLDEPISPSMLAKAAHFSLHHFHRIFRAQYGESVMQHIRRLRLERAARLIRSSGTRLIEIALSAGYESHEAFTRAFIERFGTPPSLYRERQPTDPKPFRYQPEPPKGLVQILTYPSIPVFGMRSYGSYEQVGMTWGKLLSWVQKQTTLLPIMYGICPDDTEVTEEKHLRFDACVVRQNLIPDSEVTALEIPAGTYAVGIHKGPYHLLHETYLDVIGRWFPQSGLEPAPDPVIEHYLNDPRKVKEEELQTEIRVRIAEEGSFT